MAGFAVPFQRIMVHAVSTADGPAPCIFAQLEGGPPVRPVNGTLSNGSGEEQEADEEEEEDELQSTELRLTPTDPGQGESFLLAPPPPPPPPLARALTSPPRRAQCKLSFWPCAIRRP